MRSRGHSPHWIAAAVAVAVAFGPAASQGQEFSREAIETYLRGVEAYDRGNLQEAIRLFLESYEVHHGHPNALYNAGECYERLGDIENAVEYFERYVATDLAEDRDQVYERVRNLRSRPAVYTLRSTPPGASVTVYDATESLVPDYPPVTTPGELQLPPGNYVLHFDMADHETRTRVVEGGLGRRVTLDVDLGPSTAVGPEIPGPDTGNAAYLGAYGGVVAHLTGASEPFGAAGAGVFGGYAVGDGAWRFEIGGDVVFEPYSVLADPQHDGTSERYFSFFLAISAVPGVRWVALDTLHLVASLGVGLSLYVPPDDPAVAIPWVGAKIDGTMSLIHLRPTIAVEWFPVDWLALWLAPVAADIDIALRSEVATQALVRYAAFGGASFHF